MSADLNCWKCGASIAELPLPLERRAECPACRVELHVCRLCEFFDPRVGQSCRETVAEEVQEKERANFCGYFEPTPGSFHPQDESALRSARAELEALFGEASERQPGPDSQSSHSETDAARAQLEQLFGQKATDK